MRVWYKTLAGIQMMRPGRISPKASVTPSSPTTRLPQEIVEIIIAHFIYDKRSLIVCSLTCHSWYIAAAPHLHHTMTTLKDSLTGERSWPRPLRHIHSLGLSLLVKKLQICRGSSIDLDGFSPRRLCFCLPQFLALKNIRELDIDDLNIPRFIPRIQRYFGHFLPTVQSLSLREPRGSHRQIIYFIGLFQHLEDLKLTLPGKRYKYKQPDGLMKDGMSLIPQFTPPLRGWLTMRSIKWPALLKDMIDLFGGIRFRHMDLYSVDGISLLLGACAETLETLRFYPGDPCVISCFRNLSLSQNKSLRALELTAWSIRGPLREYSSTHTQSLKVLKHMLSTVASPVFLEIVILYRDRNFFSIVSMAPGNPYGFLYRPSQDLREAEVAWHDKLFQLFREAQEVRDFQLVLCAEVWDGVGEYSVRFLKRAMAAAKAKGAFDNFSSEPIVIHSPQSTIVDERDEYWGRFLER